MIPITQNEAHLICDVLNGSLFTPGLSYRDQVLGDVEDAVRADNYLLAEKWDVDGERLIAVLRGMTEQQAEEIVAAVRRFWDGHDDPDMTVYAAFWPASAAPRSDVR